MSGDSRRRELVVGMTAIADYERGLAIRLIRGLVEIPGVQIWGIADPSRVSERTPTISVTMDGVAPRSVAEMLAQDAIYVWDGDFYAQALIERLGLFERGGVVRLGLVHYNTEAEVDRILSALERISASARVLA